MGWSFRLFNVGGTAVRVHFTFFLLLAWIAVIHWARGGPVEAIDGVLFIVGLFVCVVLHEFGHVFAARRYGIATSDVTLLPIGGVASLERMPEKPSQEIVVALAGPAVNIVIALVLMFVLGARFDLSQMAQLEQAQSTLTGRIAAANLMLFAFNLIPAFPMDGGRVLRAALAMRSGDYAQATERAARVGTFFALLFGVVGLFVVNNPFLVVVALFVWLAAAGEASAVQTSVMLDGVPIQRLMIRDIETLSPGDPLSRPVRLILDGFQQDFPVVADGTVLGMLTRAELLKALTERGEHALVGDVMNREFQQASPQESADDVLTRLKSCGCHSMPVIDGGRLLGVLTMDNVGEYVMVQAALRGTKADLARI